MAREGRGKPGGSNRCEWATRASLVGYQADEAVGRCRMVVMRGGEATEKRVGAWGQTGVDPDEV